MNALNKLEIACHRTARKMVEVPLSSGVARRWVKQVAPPTAHVRICRGGARAAASSDPYRPSLSGLGTAPLSSLGPSWSGAPFNASANPR